MAAHRHEVDSRVRNYLLEFAHAGEMVAFEDRYITDPQFLKLVELEEERLIEDYLLGRLEPASKEQFELVYQRNSYWASKVDVMRQRLQLASARPPGQNRLRTFAFATLASAACLALVVFFLFQKSSPEHTEAKLVTPVVQPFIDIRLSPGVNKGKSQAPATVPSGENRLRFTFDMPGIEGPVSCRVKLSRIDLNGRPHEIAVSPISLSRPGLSSEVTFVFDMQMIPRGDNMAELLDVNGVILERYVFQAR